MNDGQEVDDYAREDADGTMECRFCGSDWAGNTGFSKEWHKEWCIYAKESA